MKKLRLIGVHSQKEELLRELMLLGCVEVSDPAGRPDREELAAFRRPDGGKVWQKRSEQTTIVNALRLLDKHAPAKKGLLTPKPEVECAKLLDESALAADLALAGEILSLDAEARSLLTRASRERASAEAMTPWTALNVPLERMETQSCEMQLGTLPAAVPMEEVNAALSELEVSFDLVSEDKTSRYVSLLFRREDREAIAAALRPLGFSAISLPEGTGTPEQVYNAALRRSEELTAQAAQKIEELASYAAHRDALQLGADTLSTRIAREETAEKLLQSDSTFYFEGWLTAPEEKKLGETLSKYCCAWETEEPDPEHPEEVPIQLRNNALTRPYNIVTEMYSLPAYNGLDPNPFIMPFFALFFGIMFADMAYGLILLIAGLLFLWKAKPKGSMKNAAGLLIECGISTFIIGFLTGGFFGDVVSVIGGWFGRDWSIVPHLGTIHIGSIAIDLPLNLLEGNNPLYVLIAAICLGAIHLALGTGIGEEFDLNKLRNGRVIIMADADVDGAHIRTLLLTLFFRYMPQIIEKGYLYVAQPPLFRVQCGKDVTYCFSEKEMKEAQNKANGKKVDVQRYKGLGEMNAEQLWETTMNPENRIINRVEVQDAVEADELFGILMGDVVEPRRKFIEQFGKEVKNLDI